MANDTANINLLPSKGEGLAVQFFNWSFSIGRLIIILTETVALATFIYRFSLDMQIVNLHDTITSDSYIIEDFNNSEQNFRNLQTRLTYANKYVDESTVIPNLFREIVNLGRGKVTFNSLLVSAKSATIEVQAPSVSALQQFVDLLKQNSNIASVSIDKVEDKTESATVVVSITAILKPEGLDVENNQNTLQQVQPQL